MTTKQAQKQDSITIQQSKTLIKNMPYGNMEIVQLDAATIGDGGDIVVKDPKAFIMTQWLEKGVFKVLEDNHLASMTFAVYTKHPITQADIFLEAYEFKFRYVDGKTHINGVSVKSKDDIKAQAGKFVRNLVLFASSLDELPNDHWITIEIKYDHSVPDDYEPEYFKTVNRSSLRLMGSESLRVKLGKIETPHLTTEATFLGLESLIHENICNNDQSASSPKTSISNPPNIFQASVNTNSSSDDDENVSRKLVSLSVDNREDDTDENEDYETNLKKIRAYILDTGRFGIAEISTECNIHVNAVRQACKDLVQENVLLGSARGRFKVNFEAVRQHVEGKQIKIANDQTKLLLPNHQQTRPQTPKLVNQPKVPAIVEDIEEIPTTPGAKDAETKPNTKLWNALELQAKASSEEKIEKMLVPEALSLQWSQASDISNTTSVTKPNNKKRFYGVVKDPIEVNRGWSKRAKLEKIVSQT